MIDIIKGFGGFAVVENFNDDESTAPLLVMTERKAIKEVLKKGVSVEEATYGFQELRKLKSGFANYGINKIFIFAKESDYPQSETV